MRPVTSIRSQAIALMRNHVDTDQILPARFMKTMSRKGLGQHLFHDIRRREDGVLRPDCGFNHVVPGSVQVLIAGENFGCGSSREHAVWALIDFDIRCVIAPSFGDIFSVNCANNGLLLVTMAQDRCRALAEQARSPARPPFVVDLVQQRVTVGDTGFPFAIDGDERNALLQGLDRIERTLRHADAIGGYEQRFDAMTQAAADDDGR